MASNETGWTKQQRDDLARTIAESDITDGLLENADIDALVDLFEAWTERRESPSDAEQLIQLRKLAVEARDVLALLVPYGKIHTVEGVAYPDGTHSEAVDRGEHVLNQLRAALNPDLQKETQGG